MAASKKRKSRPSESAKVAPVGYASIDHDDVGRFVDWIRDRANSSSDMKKVLAKLELLKRNGIQWGQPHVRHIDGSLWELKIRGEGNTYRVYFRHEPPRARCVWYGTKNAQKADIESAQGID